MATNSRAYNENSVSLNWLCPHVSWDPTAVRVPYVLREIVVHTLAQVCLHEPFKNELTRTTAGSSLLCALRFSIADLQKNLQSSTSFFVWQSM